MLPQTLEYWGFPELSFSYLLTRKRPPKTLRNRPRLSTDSPTSVLLASDDSRFCLRGLIESPPRPSLELHPKCSSQSRRRFTGCIPLGTELSHPHRPTWSRFEISIPLPAQSPSRTATFDQRLSAAVEISIIKGSLRLEQNRRPFVCRVRQRPTPKAKQPHQDQCSPSCTNKAPIPSCLGTVALFPTRRRVHPKRLGSTQEPVPWFFARPRPLNSKTRPGIPTATHCSRARHMLGAR